MRVQSTGSPDSSRRNLHETAVLIERLVAVTLFAGLVTGVVLVLRPFATALLFGGILSVTTWPIHERLRRKGIPNGWSALILTIIAAACILVPAILVAPNLGERLVDLGHRAHTFLTDRPTAPGWLARVPIAGAKIDELWSQVARGEFRDLIAPYSASLRKLLVEIGGAVAGGVLQILLSLGVAAMFWLRGDVLKKELQNIVGRLGGPFARAAVENMADSVRGVAYGVVGTAVMQALAMTLGLWIVGVPGAAALGTLTLLLAISQIGILLVVIWGGAAWWLYDAGQHGWAIFMIVWGLFVSIVDNVVRPWLVSFGTPLPMTLVFIGVLGGFIAFGFLGLFIGPILLAVFLALLRAWQPGP